MNMAMTLKLIVKATSFVNKTNKNISYKNIIKTTYLRDTQSPYH